MTHPHSEHVVVDIDERVDSPLPNPPPTQVRPNTGTPAFAAGEGVERSEAGGGKPAAVVDETPAAVVDENASSEGTLPAHAIRNDDGSVTLPLRRPQELQIRSASGQVRTERFDVLTFHRLTGADLRAIAAAARDSQGAVMLARSARRREPIMNALFDRMDGADIADAVKVVESFFPSGPSTGR